MKKYILGGAFVLALTGGIYFYWTSTKPQTPPPPPVITPAPRPVVVEPPAPVEKTIPVVQDQEGDSTRVEWIKSKLAPFKIKEGYNVQNFFKKIFKSEMNRHDLYLIKKNELLSAQQVRKLEIMFEKEILFPNIQQPKYSFIEGLNEILARADDPYLESDILHLFLLARKIHQHDQGLLIDLQIENPEVKALVETLFELENYRLISFLENFYYGRLTLTYHPEGVAKFKQEISAEEGMVIPGPIERVLKFDNPHYE